MSPKMEPMILTGSVDADLDSICPDQLEKGVRFVSPPAVLDDAQDPDENGLEIVEHRPPPPGANAV